MAEPWKSGLFDCFSDCGTCCVTFVAPCIQYGLNAEQLDGSSCAGHCCAYYILEQLGCCCLIHMQRRQALRQRYNLEEDCNDCLATTFCAPCAICQESREMAFRGPPVTQSMAGNVAYGQPVVYAQQQQYAPPPPMPGYPNNYAAPAGYQQPQYQQQQYQQGYPQPQQYAPASYQ